MKIFREQPKLSAADEKRLTEGGFLDGWNKLVKALKDKRPTEDDLKRLVLMELRNELPRRPILEKLLVQIQKRERTEIAAAIKAVRPNLSNI